MRSKIANSEWKCVFWPHWPHNLEKRGKFLIFVNFIQTMKISFGYQVPPSPPGLPSNIFACEPGVFQSSQASQSFLYLNEAWIHKKWNDILFDLWYSDRPADVTNKSYCPLLLICKQTLRKFINIATQKLKQLNPTATYNHLQNIVRLMQKFWHHSQTKVNQKKPRFCRYTLQLR